MTIQKIKKQVAQLITGTEDKWRTIYGREGVEPTPEERTEYSEYHDRIEEQIKSLIPSSEKLLICLTGCAEGELSHYDIEDSLQTVFKKGEGIQYDSEGGQFWVYVKPTLVQKVLRHIDFHFPGKLELNVGPNDYADNPWFQNWDQARRYLKELGE
jgi:hypothetical protein